MEATEGSEAGKERRRRQEESRRRGGAVGNAEVRRGGAGGPWEHFLWATDVALA